jgi:hypothetical protein
MDTGHRRGAASDNVAAVRAHAWYWANRLEWTVKMDGQIVARFAQERDARGFAAARYRGDATVERRHNRRASSPPEVRASRETDEHD